MDAAPAPGPVDSLRPTAIPRPWIKPLLIASRDRRADHAADDPAVRRYWSAIIGPGAVADLLRLISAAVAGRALRRPLHLQVLLREGLVQAGAGSLLVERRVPALSDGQQSRLSPRLRAEYRSLLENDEPPASRRS